MISHILSKECTPHEELNLSYIRFIDQLIFQYIDLVWNIYIYCLFRTATLVWKYTISNREFSSCNKIPCIEIVNQLAIEPMYTPMIMYKTRDFSVQTAHYDHLKWAELSRLCGWVHPICLVPFTQKPPIESRSLVLEETDGGWCLLPWCYCTMQQHIDEPSLVVFLFASPPTADDSLFVLPWSLTVE